MNLQDNLITLDEYTEFQTSVFGVELSPGLPYSRNNPTLSRIILELNPDMIEITRDVYTFLDLLSDIGGIQGMLIGLVSQFFVYWEYNQLENYMISKLYGVNRGNKSHNLDNLSDIGLSDSTLKVNCFDGPRQLCSSLLSCFYRLCFNRKGRSSRMQAFKEARSKLQAEINIVDIITSRRYFHEALKHLLPKAKRLQLIKET